MNVKLIVGVVVAVTLLSVAVTPAAAVQPAEQVDECKNADKGPGGDGGPPGFVADLVPDFLSDLIGSLPAPDFVKSAFGAETC